MTRPLRYECFATDPSSRARLGRITTLHGHFDTPAFMPVGTQGTIKGLVPSLVKDTGAQCILANTYHLMLRPGEKVVRDLGDLHRFMNWQGPILTDSGGFQVFSLSELNKITDDGVTFTSQIDGSKHHLTPARSIQVQNDLGADIIMCFDQCPDSTAPRETQVQAIERTIRWASVCKDAHARPTEQSLFGIVQGGLDLDLRRKCAEALVKLDFPGYAVGGLAVGEGFEEMLKVLDVAPALLPTDRPRYLMGVGYPRDIVEAVARGIDMFDCVLPTRNGRSACAWTPSGQIRLKNAKYIRDTSPVEEGCDCPCCKGFTRGALRHFFMAGEMLGPILLSLHNVRFYQRFMADLRESLRQGRFDEFRRSDPRCVLGGGVGGGSDVTRATSS
ncbi:MAG: tRNA guanosine(34) transglycosylase Tgt [Tepidisphaeraceae bacterium]